MVELCSKNEYTKSESNSQQWRNALDVEDNCVQRTNIQNLKAIHNGSAPGEQGRKLCSKNEYTKSESNSQHVAFAGKVKGYCVQRTNIQNLKAIHNISIGELWTIGIVFKERIYKI